MIIVAITLALSATLLFSSYIKLTREGRTSFSSTIHDLGVRNDSLRNVIVNAVPLLEGGLGIFLLIPSTRLVAAFISICMLSTFSLVAIWTVLHDRRIACSCFGNLGESELGWFTVARNVLLIACLVGIIVLPGTRIDNALTLWNTLLGLSLVLNGGLAIALLLVMREYGGMLKDLRIDSYKSPTSEQLAPGAAAPEIGLLDTKTGIHATIPQVLREFSQGGVALFLSEHCPACQEVLPSISSWSEQLTTKAGMVLIMIGGAPGEDITGMTRESHNLHILVDETGEAGNAFGVRATPSAVSLDSEGRITGYLAIGPQSIYSLLQSLV